MAPATIRARQLPVRRFASWLAEEGEIPTDPFLGLKSPKLDDKVVEPLTDDELRRLLAACQPPKGAAPLEALRHRRDEAILRLMLETGARAGEVVAMVVPDLDLIAGTAVIRRGKGGKGRVVPLGPHATRAIDRYLRLRRHHRLGETSPALWLGDRGKKFSYDALHKTLGERAAAAGLTGFHPHKMRHTAAHRWLSAGGSETGLMAVAGWTRPDMLMRYTKAQAAARAAEEARALNLGDLRVHPSPAQPVSRSVCTRLSVWSPGSRRLGLTGVVGGRHALVIGSQCGGESFGALTLVTVTFALG